MRCGDKPGGLGMGGHDGESHWVVSAQCHILCLSICQVFHQKGIPIFVTMLTIGFVHPRKDGHCFEPPLLSWQVHAWHPKCY